MRQNFEWKVKRSNKTTLHLVYIVDNCSWKLKVVRRDEGTYFQVRSFVNEHSCPLEEVHRCHRQASVVTIGEVIAPRLQQHNGRLMRPKDVMADMETMNGIQIMYNKAHDALQYALSLTYGTHEESFQMLPSFAYVLEQQNPGTITDLQCADDDKFLNFLMSLGSSIRGFQRCMRPVIAVDGTHLKGSVRLIVSVGINSISKRVLLVMFSGLEHVLIQCLIEFRSFRLLIHKVSSPNVLTMPLYVLLRCVDFIDDFRDDFSTVFQSCIVVFVRERVTVRNPKTDSNSEFRRPRYGPTNRRERGRGQPRPWATWAGRG
ncbi:hypothetical protein LWI29_020411 [Acer saccharum]|uniref:Uncharacterized protein n=1 Tax=Acer saccharum TaxID=4024 RepID=A0AA39SDV2_ACESA|nr:hypothetical protein LWI29_020411 [Acer saccharum]